MLPSYVLGARLLVRFENLHEFLQFKYLKPVQEAKMKDSPYAPPASYVPAPVPVGSGGVPYQANQVTGNGIYNVSPSSLPSKFDVFMRVLMGIYFLAVGAFSN